VTQFRNDCKANPIGLDGNNHGTWFESRNGWCPGSVEPGIFVDVTQWLGEGSNKLEVSVLVWNNLTHAYEYYSDYSGFAYNDAASLTVGLNLFVYDATAVAAAKALEHPSTDAELALQTGLGGVGVVDPHGTPVTLEPVGLLALGRGRSSSEPRMSRARESLAEVVEDTGDGAAYVPRALRGLYRQPEDHFMMISGDAARGRATTVPVVLGHTATRKEARAAADGSGFPDIEGRAPWYLRNETNGTGLGSGFIKVPAMTSALVQGATRTVYAHVEASALPEDWGRVALHFQLSKPPDPMEYDHWDRLGSFGLRLEGDEDVLAHVQRGLEPRDTWFVTPP
jgi:hypothetical protein